MSDWRDFENWSDAGAVETTERARRLWKRMRKEYQAPPIDPGIVDGLNDYIARRKEEIPGSWPRRRRGIANQCLVGKSVLPATRAAAR